MVQPYSSLTPQQNFDNLEASLLDPVTQMPLTEAVTLPCTHNFNLSTLKKLVQKVCPICRQAFTIMEAKPNPGLREVVKHAVTLLPMLSQQIADGPLPVLPFPGKPAELCRVYEWTRLDDVQNPEKIRWMQLRCMGSRVFINKVSIFGHVDDSISAVVQCSAFKDNVEPFRSYFSRLGLARVDYTKLSCEVSEPREFDWLLHFLTEKNTFHREIDKIRTTRLLQEKQWKQIELDLSNLEGKAAPAEGKGQAPHERKRQAPNEGKFSAAPPAYEPPAEGLPPAYDAIDEVEQAPSPVASPRNQSPAPQEANPAPVVGRVSQGIANRVQALGTARTAQVAATLQPKPEQKGSSGSVNPAGVQARPPMGPPPRLANPPALANVAVVKPTPPKGPPPRSAAANYIEHIGSKDAVG